MAETDDDPLKDLELDEAGYAIIHWPDREGVLGLSEYVIPRVADALKRRANATPDGIAGLGERADLEAATIEGLDPIVHPYAKRDRKVTIPDWPNVGRVDIVVGTGKEDPPLAWIAELKWCGPGRDVLYEAIWDLFKAALVASQGEPPRTFLLFGAERNVWAKSAYADLFEDGTHDPVELCTRRCPDRKHTLGWDDLLRGGYEHPPNRVPATITTERAGRADVGEWELRAVRVNAVADAWVPFKGGWPNGDRPAEARYPKAL
jgi:hypothetical protein